MSHGGSYLSRRFWSTLAHSPTALWSGSSQPPSLTTFTFILHSLHCSAGIYNLCIVHCVYCTSCVLYILCIVHRVYCTSCVLYIVCIVQLVYCTTCVLYIVCTYNLCIVHRVYCTSCVLYNLCIVHRVYIYRDTE